METGQLSFAPGMFVEPEEADFIEPRKLTYLASGSQGEPLSALAKLAIDNHPRVHVENGDMVVLSSRFIPGNERSINNLVNQLYKLGAEVIYDAVAPVHVSGHASRDELTDLIALVKPRYFVPIHGEYRHLSRHLALAAEAGIPERNCFLLEDGDSLVLTGAEAYRSRKAHTGRILMEAGEVEDIALIGERRSSGARRHGDRDDRGLGEQRNYRRRPGYLFARFRVGQWNLGASAAWPRGSQAAARRDSAPVPS